ncbi:MAG: Hsp33 family molecular chaperone HslO [Rhodospirillales bacterium]|nr:Hsp33 family molecular chaperone HslO [Rhodospirillales bacterium]
MAERAVGAAPPPADQIQPFLLEVPALRGRLVRMGPLVDSILNRHDYPQPVAALLGELLALAGVLSSLLKFDGIFTLQTKGDGPVGMLVADMTTAGELRGYAEYDQARLAAAGGATASARALMGEGHMAFTVDQGVNTERYQGIVELKGETLAEILAHYFRQSEQLKTAVELAARRVEGGWRAGGLLLQQLPEEEAVALPLATDEEDSWRRAVVLMASCTARELLDPALSAHDLLYRLFHDERVRVFEPRALSPGCRCSRGRIERILRSLPRDEVADMKVGGEVVMTCQFCNIDFRFDERALERIYAH